VQTILQLVKILSNSHLPIKEHDIECQFGILCKSSSLVQCHFRNRLSPLIHT